MKTTKGKVGTIICKNSSFFVMFLRGPTALTNPAHPLGPAPSCPGPHFSPSRPSVPAPEMLQQCQSPAPHSPAGQQPGLASALSQGCAQSWGLQLPPSCPAPGQGSGTGPGYQPLPDCLQGRSRWLGPEGAAACTRCAPMFVCSWGM